METRIDRIFKTAKDKNFIKLCAKTAKEIGITAEEWADSKKKITIILWMANIAIDNKSQQAGS